MKDVIIIGSGVGGSAVGALLANSGKFNVTLIEKSSLIGGRFATYNKDGFNLDVGCHMLANCDKGPFGRVLDICGCPDYVKWRYAQKPSPIINFKGEYIKFPYEAHKLGFSKQDLDNFMRFYLDISKLTNEQCDKLDNISIREYVSKYVDSDLARGIVGFFASIYFVTPDGETPVGEYVRCQNEIGKYKALGYPIGGTGAVPKAYCKIIEERGCKVINNMGVKSIIIEDKKATGVILDNGQKLKADIVISNAAIKDTINYLVGMDKYPKEYVDKINSYKYSYNSYALKIALDKKLTDETMIFYIGHEDLTEVEKTMEKTGDIPDMSPHLMIPVISNMDPGAAPEGKQLIIAGGSPKMPYNAGADVWKKWEKSILKALEVVFPGIQEHILWKLMTTPEDINNFAGEDGSVIGIAQILGQVGENRPKIIDQHVKNLYHCSADTGMHGIGGELAMDAAFRLYEHLS